MDYYEIGERFEYEGVVLEVVRYSSCSHCYFDKNTPCGHTKDCDSFYRKDVNNVCFKLVEQCKTKNIEQENNDSKKNDRLDDKLRWELLSLEDVEDIVRVYTAGAKKYGENKWQDLPDGIRRYKAALLRHLVEFDKGNEIDEETGCYSLAAVAWNAIAMLHISKQQKKNGNQN